MPGSGYSCVIVGSGQGGGSGTQSTCFPGLGRLPCAPLKLPPCRKASCAPSKPPAEVQSGPDGPQ